MIKEISLSKFLSRYVSLNGEDLKKITHAEVKKLFPELKRSSFDEISENPELLVSGKVILVSDGKHRIPYYVPKVMNEGEDLEFHREAIPPREIDDTVYDYTKMSIYELRCLLARKFNSYRNQACARRELNRRGIELSRKYKRCDFKRKNIDE